MVSGVGCDRESEHRPHRSTVNALHSPPCNLDNFTRCAECTRMWCYVHCRVRQQTFGEHESRFPSRQFVCVAYVITQHKMHVRQVDYGNRSHWNRDWSRWSRTYHVITTTTKTHQHTNCVSTHEYMRGNRKNTIAMCVNGHKRVISKHHLNGSTLHGNLSVVTHSPTTSSIYSVAMVSDVFERHPMQRFELPTTARKCRTYAPIKWLAAVIM